MNQQSDSTDLLGGYKPVDISHTMHNILQTFNKVVKVDKQEKIKNIFTFHNIHFSHKAQYSTDIQQGSKS